MCNGNFKSSALRLVETSVSEMLLRGETVWSFHVLIFVSVVC
uniref:Uncharacterized protein n=1 Tax=Mesocestoides corti TaxID=53468 RepID=A0A5K3ESE7_MESCO